jgi:cytochrome c-type biogenesis protein CcmH
MSLRRLSNQGTGAARLTPPGLPGCAKMSRAARVVLVCLWAMLCAIANAQAEPRVDGEVALEQRLVAPCCWVQTLDVHDSPVARDLRAEIHRRLAAGEPAQKIEADLVDRYGERIRAMPPGNPLAKTAAVVFGAVALAALLLVLLVRRWVKRDRTAAAADAPAGDAAVRDKYDDELDDQLRKMD